MSFEAMALAVKADLPARDKIVLLMLANRVNSDTGRCTPRIKLLAEDCGMSESSCKAALKRLVELGLIEIRNRFDEGVQKPNQYFLKLDG
ncbi:MAG: helix-turn-helix domain-containing protein, partial [Halopseudomonas aestusnigri]|nr:helix-turn-helix domain-containing protein [Halopseudomonas aestusnigri]